MIFINKKTILLLLGLLLSSTAPVSVSASLKDSGINAGLLYHNYCSVCHGDKGDGKSRASESLNPPPRDFTSATVKRELTRERIQHSITYGREGTAMAAWQSQLSKNEINALTEYLLTTFIHADDRIAAHPGKAVYEKNCSVCHGDKGDGGRWTGGLMLRPRDFTSLTVDALDRGSMIATVTNGRPGTPMTAFAGQLDVQKIDQVVDYIRLAFMSAPPEIAGISGTRAHGMPQTNGTPTGASEMDAPLPDALQGDIARGRDFYMGNCFTCHGTTGRGDGPRAYFINPRPADFFADKYQNHYNRPTLFRAIRDGKLGTEMPAWGKVLDRQQLADVTEFVFQAYIRGDESVLREVKKKTR